MFRNKDCIAMLLAGVCNIRATELEVSGRIELRTPKKSVKRDRSDVVVWLTPLDQSPSAAPEPKLPSPRLVQRNKKFEPHVLVVPAGTAVEFPNRDPFFHNVFSLFEGKRFDLGLYEAGSTRTVHFDHPGVSYIFCNIHPEMSAAVLALTTPYYTITKPDGLVRLQGVPTGRYRMQVWYEGSSPDVLKRLAREVTISLENSDLGVLEVLEDSPVQNHKNKYGRDYDTRTSQPNPYNPN
jgi:plastocyanin